MVTPVMPERYRVEDYAAYYRMVLATLRAELAKGHDALIADYYPEPVEACPVCGWARQMQRRSGARTITSRSSPALVARNASSWSRRDTPR